MKVIFMPETDPFFPIVIPKKGSQTSSVATSESKLLS